MGLVCRTAQMATVHLIPPPPPPRPGCGSGDSGFSIAWKRSYHSSSPVSGHHSPQLSPTRSACKVRQASCNSPSPECSEPCRPLQSRARASCNGRIIVAAVAAVAAVAILSDADQQTLLPCPTILLHLPAATISRLL